MLDELTSSQLSEWEAYDKIDPIGSWRSDFNFANLSSLIVNIINSLYHEEGKTPELVTPIDFMPVWDVAQRNTSTKSKKTQSVDEMRDILMAFAESHNRSVRQKKAIAQMPPKKLRKKWTDS